MKSVSRLGLVVGCLIATREVYLYLIVRARQVSNWFGDMIFKPNFNVVEIRKNKKFVCESLLFFHALKQNKHKV